MSFSAEVKKEIAGGIPSSPDRIAASLATILMCIGEIRVDDGGLWELWLLPDNRAALTKCFTLLQKTANITTIPGSGNRCGCGQAGRRSVLI